MKYLQALAVVVFAGSLAMATGCEPEKAAPPPKPTEKATSTPMQKESAAANKDVKPASDDLAALRSDVEMKNAEIQKLQKQLDAANAKIAEMTKTMQDVMKLAAPTAPAK